MVEPKHSWHALQRAELQAALGVSDQGLTSAEARQRLQHYGYNELAAQSTPFWRKLIEPFRSVFIIVLLLAAAISFINHEALDGVVITAIIAINTLIYYTQAQTTDRVLKSLKQHSQQSVLALRDGQTITLPARLLVPGDVILLSEGRRVPADGRLFHEENLFMSEATLTGESLPIKKAVATLAATKPIYEQTNMVFSGTYVTAGSGVVLIVATGAGTQFGSIAKMVAQPESASPMQQKIDKIVGRLIKAIGLVALIVFGLSMLRDMATAEALRFVMAMSVAAVPEDLPIALSVIAVLGMRRMARKNALVRSMRTIEDLGLTTVIATDKTGTLTKNSLSVVTAWPVSPHIDLKTIGRQALGNALNATEPFDQALAKFAGAEPGDQRPLKNYPFNQLQRLSGALWDEAGPVESALPARDPRAFHRAGQAVLYVKGAPEHLLNLCNLAGPSRSQAESQLHSLVAKGYRVIGFAKANVAAAPANLSGVDSLGLEFQGLIAFADELRPESAPAIAAAQAAGISVKMITGDHFETAYQISQAVGISTHRDQVITGSDLPSSEAALAPLLKTKSVFARILPQQKFNILKILKRTEVTAMTGDGVNDVPALTNAHVGIAMGSGDDIAKDAGDMVLLDNSFASIVSAISEGRIIYDNIRRMLFYLLSTTLGEMLTMIGALLIGLPLPVTAIMILWVNLVTDTVLVIPLGLEPAEADHMSRPPRRPQTPILDRLILSRTLLVGAAMALPTLLIFNMLIKSGYSVDYAQTVAFMMLVAGQWINAFNARSERLSAFRRLKVVNYKLLLGLAVAIVLQLLVMFGPLKTVFGVATVSMHHLLVGILAVTGSVLLAAEAHKLYSKKTSH